jgi:hypothetical protein
VAIRVVPRAITCCFFRFVQEVAHIDEGYMPRAVINVPGLILVGRFSTDPHWPVLGDLWGHNYKMSMTNIGQVIATRRLFLADEPNREIFVQMGKPEKTPGRDDYSCALQVTGIGNKHVYRIFGVDAFQAIELGFRFIGVRLALVNRDAEGRLRWECDDKGGFGFPGTALEEQ